MFVSTLGVSNRTEIIPFEPDPGNAGEGKSDGNAIGVVFSFLIRVHSYS